MHIGPRKIGAIINLANHKLSFGELALLIDHNCPKVILYAADVADMVTKAVEKAEHKPVRLVMADNLEGEEKFLRVTTAMKLMWPHSRKMIRKWISCLIFMMK